MVISEFEALVIRIGETDCHIPVALTLAYDENHDPLAVQMLFTTGDDTIQPWVVCRDQLSRGINSPYIVGKGDFRIRCTSGGQVFVCLRNQSGHADLSIPHERLADFLEETETDVDHRRKIVTHALDAALLEILS
jgi:hypothetical protein